MTRIRHSGGAVFDHANTWLKKLGAKMEGDKVAEGIAVVIVDFWD